VAAQHDLPELAQSDARVRGILEDSTVAHRQAARDINMLLGEGTTSEKSVRRFRSRLRAGALADPQPTTHIGPVSGSGGRWTPGIDIDPRQGGEFRTKPRVVNQEAPAAEPEEADLLAEFDLDPALWEVTGARKSTWQSGDRWMEARRVSFRKRVPGEATTVADVEAIMSNYYAVPHLGAPKWADKPDRIVMIPAGDLQLGKGEGGGTAATVDRFCRIVSDIAARLVSGDRARQGRTSLVLPWLGDCIEGTVMLKGRALTTLDIPVTEQVRTYRRLMMHQIATLAPVGVKVVIPVVPGNHDETTRKQIMPVNDSWAIEGASAVADWMAGRPEYAHVEFVFPDPGDLGITLNVGSEKNPYVVSFTHGHIASSSSGIIPWWKGQAYGRHHEGSADMQVSAHFHHLRVEHTGGRRTWLQIPALDGGSEYYRARTGEDSQTGMVSLEIAPGTDQGWRALTVHT
jgi:hypothetical protein